VYGWLPNTTFTMRDWEMSQQFDNLWNRPRETGIAHARDWIAWRDNGRFGQSAWKSIPNFDNDRTVVLGINEPSLYGHLNRRAEDKAPFPSYSRAIECVNLYTVAFLDTLAAAGMRGGAMNLSVGFPDNTGTDTRPNWEAFAPIYAALKRGNHVLILHEYFGLQGYEENKWWHVGRSRMCPWDVPIIIGECGFDKGVYPNWQPPRGWNGTMPQERYISLLRDLDNYYKDDPRIHSAQVYTYDYGNNEWETFSVRAMREAFIAYVRSVRALPDTNRVTTFPTYPAGIVNPLPSAGGGTTPPQPTLKTELLALAEQRLVLEFNPTAGLQKVIARDDFNINSPEFWHTHGGKVYVAQRAEHLTTGKVRVYFAESGKWDNVKFVERGAA
jgi:hypothetical protein